MSCRKMSCARSPSPSRAANRRTSHTMPLPPAPPSTRKSVRRSRSTTSRGASAKPVRSRSCGSGIPVMPFTVREIRQMQRTLASGSEQDKTAVRTRLEAVPVDMRPPIEPGSSVASTDREAASSVGSASAYSVQAAASIDADETAEKTNTSATPSNTGGHAGSPATEPASGSQVYQAAEAQAVKPTNLPMTNSVPGRSSRSMANGSSWRALVEALHSEPICGPTVAANAGAAQRSKHRCRWKALSPQKSQCHCRACWSSRRAGRRATQAQ